MSQVDESNKLVDSFGVFTFDLNVGQSCEYAYPPDVFDADDLKAISMLSFPDSQSTNNCSNYDCVYTFAYKQPTKSASGLTLPIKSKGARAAASVQCYVYFRQVEDPSNARGYYQKSLVLISSSSGTFTNADELLRMARRVGTKFFIADENGGGREVLADAYSEVDQPDLSRDISNSSDLGMRLSPLSTRSIDLSSITSPSTSFSTVDTLFSLLEGLWHLWEAVLVGLPVLVYAPGCADVCSRTVIAISTLIAPLEYRGDMRPFLSIFDPEYASFRTPVSRACIVGLTSPMALSQLAVSFSVLVILSRSPESVPVDTNAFLLVSRSAAGCIYIADSITSVSSGTKTRVASLTSKLMAPSPDGAYRLTVPSDACNVSKRIVTGLHGGSDTTVSNRLNRALIQRHFGLLTRDVLMPLVEYVETDSSRLKLDVYGETPRVARFIPARFFKHLVAVGRQLSLLSREKLISLYAGFVRTETFVAWLRSGQRRANQEAVLAHAQLVIAATTPDRVMWLTDEARHRASARIAALVTATRGSVADELTAALHLINPPSTSGDSTPPGH